MAGHCVAPAALALGAGESITVHSYSNPGSSRLLVPEVDYLRLLHPPAAPSASSVLPVASDRVVRTAVHATLTPDLVRIDETIELDLGVAGSRLVPLVPRRHDAVLTSARGPGLAIVTQGGILFQTTANGKTSVTLQLERALARSPGGTLVLIPCTPAPLQRLEIELGAMPSRPPRVEGAVVSSLVRQGGGAVLALAGLGGDKVSIDLASAQGAPGDASTPQTAPAQERAPEIWAQTAVRMTAQEHVVHARAIVTASVRGAPIMALDVGFESEATVIDISGEAVATWTSTGSSRLPAVHVDLAAPAQDTATLVIDYDVPAGRLVVPRVAQGYREIISLGIDGPGHLMLTLAPAPAPWRAQDQSRPGAEMAALGSDNLQMLVCADLYHAAGTLAPLPPLALGIVPLRSTGFVQATIDVAEAVTVVTDDGHLLGRITYLVKNLTEQFLAIQEPGPDVVLLSALVAGHAVQAGRRGDGKLLIPLGRSGQTSAGAAAFPVEITYLSGVAGLAEGHSIALALPHADLDVATLRWTLELPAGWAPVGEAGTVRRDERAHAVEFAGVESGEVTGPTPGEATALFDAGTTPLAIALPHEPETSSYSADLVEAQGPAPSLVFTPRARTTGMVHRALAFLAGLILLYSLLRRSPRGRARTLATLAGLAGTLVIVGVFSWASTTLGLAVHLALGLFMGAVIFGLASLAIGSPSPREASEPLDGE